MAVYDTTNVFWKILQGEVPCQKIQETQHSLVFRDRDPKAPLHYLAIPKGPYRDFSHFTEKASSEEILDFWQAVNSILENNTQPGARLVTNQGPQAGQVVFHFHIHILGGRSPEDFPAF